MSILKPDKYVRSIYVIDFAELKNKGIKGIFMDLDNTLIAWDSQDIPPEIIHWSREVKKLGFALCLVSNGKGDRVSKASAALDIPFVSRALKPTPVGFRKALKQMNLEKQETAMLGDQIFTDVLGANLTGLYTVLVVPLKSKEFAGTKINRQLEKLVMRILNIKPE